MDADGWIYSDLCLALVVNENRLYKVRPLHNTATKSKGKTSVTRFPEQGYFACQSLQ